VRRRVFHSRGAGQLSSRSDPPRENGGGLAASLYRAIVDTAADAIIVVDAHEETVDAG
jgi:hypothetical protein